MTSEDIPQSQGPDASIPFGGGTQVAAAQRSLESQTGGGPKGGNAVTAGPGPGEPAPLPPPPQSQPAPAQDSGVPRTPDGRLDMSKVFMNTQTVPNWRQNADVWASSPGAGTYLKFLGKHSKADIGKK